MTNQRKPAILEKPYYPRPPNKIPVDVIDAIMGSGKTTAMLQKINRSYGLRFIYVTPYLDEIDRVISGTRDFKQPEDKGSSKLESLHKLLLNGHNVAMTHQLFLMATQETIELIYHGKYFLILDEALQTLHKYNDIAPKDKMVNWGDIKWLRDEGYIEADEHYNVTWKGRINDDKEWHYSEVQRLALNGSLKWIDKNLFWEYPAEIFRAFQSIFILTYLFSNTMLDMYLQMNGFKYEMVSVEDHDGKFELCDYTDSLEKRQELAKLIDIYDGKYNEIGDNPYAFSKKWIEKQDREQIKTIKKAMRNYKNLVKAEAANVMWTAIKTARFVEKIEGIMGFNYIRKLTAEEKALPEKELRKLKQFVPVNARATNDFADRTVLMYMANRFLNPEYEKYFHARGYTLDEDQFAISELVQWIWRSAIRKNQKIHIFIPSIRMRNLLKQWLGVEQSE